MKILRNSEETNSMKLTSSPEDSHVRTSHKPGKEQVSKKEQGPVFGLNSCGLLAIYDPDLHSLRTCQCSLFGAEQESLKILPKSGMTQSGRLLGQTMWVQDIGEKEFGLWLTPGTVQIEPTKGRREKRIEFRKSIGRKDNPGSLAEQITEPKFWPTPTKLEIDASNSRTVIGNREIDKKGRTWGASLTTVVQTQEKLKNKPQETFPTPIAGDWKGQVRSKGEPGMLSGVVEKEAKMFPTPRAREIDEKVETWQKRMDKRAEEGKPPVSKNLSMTVKNFPTPMAADSVASATQHQDSLGKRARITGGKLNPNWVEWLMGYPVGWTDLKDSETP